MRYGIIAFLVMSVSAQAETWMYPVQSEYIDEANGDTMLSRGTLFLFEYHEKEYRRVFGVTAAHVSQGSSVRVQGLEGPILDRLADNVMDVEILEFDPNSAPSPGLHWNSKSKAIVLGFEVIKNFEQGSGIRMEGKDNSDSAFVVKTPWIRATRPLGYRQEFAKTTQLFYSDDRKYRDELVYLPLTRELYAPAFVETGMSGTPLIKLMLVGRDLFALEMQIVGIALRTQRDLPGTWFAPKTEFARLFSEYLKGARGVKPSARWKLRNGLSYREFADGQAEIPFLRNSIGNFTRSDGGNLTRSDGGDFGPLGKRERGELRPNLWQELGIQPGVKWKAKNSTIAYRIPGVGVLYAEDSAALLAENLRLPVSGFEAVPIETHYTAHFIEKFTTHLEGQVRVARKSATPSASLNSLLKHLTRISKSLRKDPKGLKINEVFFSPSRNSEFGKASPACPEFEKFSVLRHQVRLLKGRLYFEIYGPKPHEERFDFVLDELGRKLNSEGLPESPFFLPVVRVVGAQGEEAVVDLRRFFFMDAFEVYLPPVVLSDNPWQMSLGGQIVMDFRNLLPKEWVKKIEDPETNVALYVAYKDYHRGPILRMQINGDAQIYDAQFGWTRMHCKN